jgi:hypothetical protein
MKKHTCVNLIQPDFSIELGNGILAAGSCFAQEISRYFRNNGIYILENPFGTIYNSYSIYKIFLNLFSSKIYEKNDLILENNKFISLDHSTSFDSDNAETALEKINQNIAEMKYFLKKTGIFIITLGTSVVYVYKGNNEIAANCHKLPASLFEKKILDIGSNAENLKKTVMLIKDNVKSPKIILTLSPVRHTPDNLIENQYSKSVLRAAIENTVDGKCVYYFPSYEITNDELRDYKYYKEDGLHLKKKTVEIITGKFAGLYFSQELQDYMKEFNSLKKIRKHRSFNPGSKANFELLKKTLTGLKNLYSESENKIVEKEIFLISKKLTESFYSEPELTVLLDKNLPEKMKTFYRTVIDILNGKKEIIINNLSDYKNEHIKNLEKYKTELAGRFFLNSGN